MSSDETSDREAAATVRVHGDAIVGRADDALGRRPYAELIARQILGNRPDDGLVIAVTGPWGSGKSSLLQMIREELRDTAEQPVVIDFNPWLYSGSEQLTALFFLLLAESLPEDLGPDLRERLGTTLRAFGTGLGRLRGLPMVGGALGVAGDVAVSGAEMVDTAPQNLKGQRDALAATLSELDRHIVVFVDDVDRLQSASEIQDLMRMVKLVGDLPGITYVLSYDRRPVAAALTSNSIDGDEYLEKIIQAEHRVPQPSPEKLERLLRSELAPITDVRIGDEYDHRWEMVYEQIVRPLVRSPRHVRRLGNAVRLSIAMYDDEIDVVDQIALAAVATLLPVFHDQLPQLKRVLLGSDSYALALSRTDDVRQRLAAQLNDAAAASGNGRVAHSVYELLFPATGEVLGAFAGRDGSSPAQRRRVADPDVFDTYVTGMLPEDALPVAEVRAAIEAFGDSVQLKAMLEDRDDDRLSALFLRLQAHVAEIPQSTIQSSARLILERAISDQDSVIRPHGHAMSRARIFLAELITQLPEAERTELLRQWAAEQTTLRMFLAITEVARWGADSTRSAVGRDAMDALDGELARRAGMMPSDELAVFPDLGRVLYLIHKDLERSDPAALDALVADDRVFVKYLSLYTEPTPPGETSPLAWRTLVEAVDERWLRGRIAAVSPDFTDPDTRVQGALDQAREFAARSEENAG